MVTQFWRLILPLFSFVIFASVTGWPRTEENFDRSLWEIGQYMQVSWQQEWRQKGSHWVFLMSSKRVLNGSSLLPFEHCILLIGLICKLALRRTNKRGEEQFTHLTWQHNCLKVKHCRGPGIRDTTQESEKEVMWHSWHFDQWRWKREWHLKRAKILCVDLALKDVAWWRSRDFHDIPEDWQKIIHHRNIPLPGTIKFLKNIYIHPLNSESNPAFHSNSQKALHIVFKHVVLISLCLLAPQVL